MSYINFVSKPYHQINIRSLEEDYNARYMGTWDHHGTPAEIFFLHQPEKIGGFLAEHYFAVYYDGDEMKMEPADHVFNHPIVGVQAKNGEVCVSRFADEHYVSEDNSVWIAGGREFMQTNCLDRLMRIYVVRGQVEYEPIGFLETHRKQTGKGFYQIFQWP